MGPRDYTEIGGTGGHFMTTHWSLVEKAGTPDEDPQRLFMGLLMDRYWRPVYCYLRRKGYDNERAKDLTQGFFHEVVLERRLIEKADAARGRFRSFLLMALDRYLVSVLRRETAGKRLPKGQFVPLDMTDPPELPDSLIGASPEESFNYVWFTEMLERMLAVVEESFHKEGHSDTWHLFRDRVLLPIMEGSPAPSIQSLCDRYGVSDGATLSKRVYTVKRRLRSTLQRMLRESLAAADSLVDEMEQIRSIYPRLATGLLSTT